MRLLNQALRTSRTTKLIGALVLSLSLGSLAVYAVQDVDLASLMRRGERLQIETNYLDAAKLFRKVISSPDANPKMVATAMSFTASCYRLLNIHNESDEMLAEAMRVHGDEPIVTHQAAVILNGLPKFGFVIDQEFRRGSSSRRRTGGTYVSCAEQDRLQAIKWHAKAIQIVEENPASIADHIAGFRARMHHDLAKAIAYGRTGGYAWRLQKLQDLTAEPDYTDFQQQQGFASSFAPVDEQGDPLFFSLPESWQDAKSDGQRLRWAYARATELSDRDIGESDDWAQFLEGLYSVRTLSSFQARTRKKLSDEEGRFAIHTLSDNETIARLASGIKRFELPPEQNPIQIYKNIIASGAIGRGSSAKALANIYLNRRQYSRAAELIEQFPNEFQRGMLDSIRGPQVAFDPAGVKLAGEPIELAYLFRNAKKIEFTATKVDVEKLLVDLKQYYRNLSNKNQNFFGDTKRRDVPNFQNPGGFFREKQITSYLSGQPFSWQDQVEPRDNHWDKRTKTTVPVEATGLYVIEAKSSMLVNDRNVRHMARTLVWVQDTAIVRKRLKNNQVLFQLLDSKSGEPVEGANFEFFGWSWNRARSGAQNTKTQNMARRSNANGEVLLNLEQNLQWLTVARTQAGSLAVLNFEYFYNQGSNPQTYLRSKAYGISERPVYRPGERVKTKFWLAYAVYGDEEGPVVANREVRISAIDPQGNRVADVVATTDEYGGCEFEFEMPESAMLGRYSFRVFSQPPNAQRRNQQGQVIRKRDFRPFPGNFETSLAIRVEEYRKPEFEVNIISPSKPVALGETVEARVQAKYYFGAPVTDAKVHVKVERTTYSDNFYPVMPYDWCYGPGYWWFADDYSWYPGWKGWCGCILPRPGWYRGSRIEPPELIMEQDVELDATGEAVIKIDTAAAKALFGDEEDHKYSISVEVRDSSRRTITAQGEVVAASEAFKVYTWLDRGFYEAGSKVKVNFQSRMLDGTNVSSTGELQVLRITYDREGKPTERLVEKFDVSTNEEGQGELELSVQRAGQYRIKLLLDDGNNHIVEGGYLFVVRGEGLEQESLRFADLELTTDKMHYAPGDKVKLQIAANSANALVALFVRPESGQYDRPRYIRLENKTATVELDVSENDQPNFFVEAYSVYDGKYHSKTKEIVVPPEERVLDVKIASDKEQYLPGEEAKVSLEVRDANGKPTKGSVVIAAYDRSLDQISPDTLPPDIREFFWKWRRNHYPQHRHSLQSIAYPVSISGVRPLRSLGIFGRSVADDFDSLEEDSSERLSISRSGPASGMGMYGGGMYGGGMVADAEMAAPMAAKSMRQVSGGAGVARGQGQQPPKPKVRKDFADAALWLAELETDAAGKATANFKMPENLTGWKLSSWVMGSNKNVGSATTRAVTKKPLLVRLQTPRFLVERDEVVCSTIVHNDTKETKSVKVSLEIVGETQMEFMPSTQVEQVVEIAPFEQRRVDWRCRALAEGKVKLRTYAISDDASDAMELQVPIVVYGTLKTDSWAGTVRSGAENSVVEISIPEERREEQSELTIRVSPSLAASMLDSLPYLASYPYGCTEQTLNRFLPTVITQKVLREMEVDLDAIAARKNNLNAQELGIPEERRQQRIKRLRGELNPVFESAEVDKMVRVGVQRLTDMQNADGGWGWFPGNQSRSSAHITAQVVRGLIVARDNGVAIVPDVVTRGTNWLVQYQANQLQRLKNWEQDELPKKSRPDNTDALVFHVLTKAKFQSAEKTEMQVRLYDGRASLSVYGKALLGIATMQLGDAEQTQMLQRNIEQFLVEDEENETAFLADESSWWYWYGSSIEASAMYLKLLAASDPKGQRAARVVKYLLNNRAHGTYWNSTRDTALVVEAFGDYLRAKDELNANMEVEVFLDDKRIGTVEFTPENLFEVDNTIRIASSAVPSGKHQLTIRRSGDGDLYWNVYSTNFTREEEIEKAGLEVKIERRYYELRPATADIELVGDRANVIDKKRATYERVLIEDPSEIPSGRLVEVELLIESKNDYEYLLIEDKKPASLEAVDTQSGYFYSGRLLVYRELRDQHVGLCIERLPRGQYSLKYQLRSETPGKFTALPATIQGMYAPELVGNSRDFDLSVVDE